MGEWEDICQKCGLCCFERTVYSDGEMEIDFASPCDYLDVVSRECIVYEDRLHACKDCHKVTFWKAWSKDYLPPSCAYRRLFTEE